MSEPKVLAWGVVCKDGKLHGTAGGSFQMVDLWDGKYARYSVEDLDGLGGLLDGVPITCGPHHVGALVEAATRPAQEEKP